MRISDWSSDVCSSDLLEGTALRYEVPYATRAEVDARLEPTLAALKSGDALRGLDMTGFVAAAATLYGDLDYLHPFREGNSRSLRVFTDQLASATGHDLDWQRSEEHTSELQSLMRISYAVFCLKKKTRRRRSSPLIK